LKQVLLTESLHPSGRRLLDERADIEIVELGGDEGRLRDALTTVHGVLVRTMRISEQEFRTANNLQVVSRHGVGCDNIDVHWLSQRSIPVAIAVNSNTTSVVEHVMMMMLTLNKNAQAYDQLTRESQFAKRGTLPTSELCGKHILIVGFGRIGKRLAPLCKAFGMRVTVADIALDVQYADALGCRGVTDFKPHLSSADYVSVHVPLNAETHHLIGRNELAALPPHAIVINCARGGIIDEQALADAIKSDQLAATGSDVFENEPPAADNPLLDLPRSVLTPHSAASTAESMERMSVYAAQNVLAGIDGTLNPDLMFNRDALMAKQDA